MNLQCKLPEQPFGEKSNLGSDITGWKFICQLLSKMYSLGYDFVVSSDLNRKKNTFNRDDPHETDRVN